jgi:DNA polymerase-1
MMEPGDQMKQRQRVLLVDGYNMLHRARSGWAKGDNPIVFTFFRSFRATVDKFSPDIVYFILEGRPVARLEQMTEYKANREHHDRDDFIRQRRLIISLLKERFPVRVVRHPHFECDDVLAALANVTHAEDDVIVISSDTDFYQLLHPDRRIDLYNPIKKEFIDPPPYDYVSWKALRGDSSDNISGIRGIGNKRAEALVTDPEALAQFLEHEPNRRTYERNLELIRFHELTEEQFAEIERSDPRVDWEELRRTFDEMKFFSITNPKSWPKFVTTFSRMGAPGAEGTQSGPAGEQQL